MSRHSKVERWNRRRASRVALVAAMGLALSGIGALVWWMKQRPEPLPSTVARSEPEPAVRVEPAQGAQALGR